MSEYSCEYGFEYGEFCDDEAFFECGPYAYQILRSLPPGSAYSRMRNESFLFCLCCGLGLTLDRLEIVLTDFEREIFPCSAVDLLPDWEVALGLPGVCGTPPATLQGRQDAACAAFRANTKRLTLSEFLADAEALGYPLRLENMRKPFVTGPSAMGDALQNTPWAWTWAFRGTSLVDNTTILCSIQEFCSDRTFTETLVDLHTWAGWISADNGISAFGLRFMRTIHGRFWIALGDDEIRYVNSDSVPTYGDRATDWTDAQGFPGFRKWLDAVSTGTSTIIVAEEGNIARDSTAGTMFTNVLTSLNAMRSLGHESGTILAAGDAGEIRRSTDDGATWPVQTTPGTDDLFAVLAISPGTWLAAGVGGVVWRSIDDGVTWIVTPTGFTKDITALALRPGRIVVAVGDDLLAWSEDLITWTEAFNPIVGADYVDVAYSVIGGFLAGGSSDTLMATSVDGKSWTTIANPSIPTLQEAVRALDTDDNGDWFVVFPTDLSTAILTEPWFHNEKRV